MTALEQARRHLRERRFDSALGCAEKLIAREPSRVEAYEVRAEALLRTGRLEEALADLERAVALGPGAEARARLLDARGELHRRLGRLEAAEADATARVALAPRRPGGYLARAEARRGLGRFAAAARDLERAQALAPRDAWLFSVRAKLLRAQGRDEAALAQAERAVALDAGHAKAWAWRGEALRAVGRRAEAAQSLRRALSLDAGCAWARALLGQTLLELGRDDEGQAALEEALSLDSRGSGVYDFLAGGTGLARDPLCAWVHAWEGCARAGRGDAAGAEAAFARALELDARWDWIWRRRAIARLESGDAKGALRDLERAAALSPRQGANRLWAAQARRRLGDLEGAAVELNAAVTLSPKTAAAWGSRALVKLALGDEGGLADWRAACALEPGFAGRARAAAEGAGSRESLEALLSRPAGRGEAAWTEWAERLFASGRGRSARGPLGAALKADPRSAVLRWLRWRALDERGAGADGPAARAELEEALRLGLERADAWGRLGALRLAAGDRIGGLEALERAAALRPEDPWARPSGDACSAGAADADGRARARALLRVLGSSPAGVPARLRPRRSAVRADALRCLGRHDGAYRELARAGAAFSRAPWRWRCALGELALKAGRGRAARRALDAAVALAPERALPRCWRGELRYWLGDAEGALADLAAAAAAEPGAAWARAWRGQVLLWLGRAEEAAAELDAALSLDRGLAWAYGWRGAAAVLAGRPARGLADLERALSLDALDVEARIWKGEALGRLGRWKPALRELDRAVALDPGRPWALLARAWARAHAADQEGSLADARRARRAAPSWKSLRGELGLRELERLLAEAKGNRTYRSLHG